MNSVAGNLLLTLAVLAFGGMMVVLIHDSNRSIWTKKALWGLTSFITVLALVALVLPYY